LINNFDAFSNGLGTFHRIIVSQRTISPKAHFLENTFPRIIY
jgi:hypothetical protein